jgi:hypothetical protein
VGLAWTPTPGGINLAVNAALSPSTTYTLTYICGGN